MIVLDFLTNSAGKVPDKVAVISDDGQATFAELNTMSSRVASLLHQAGIKRGEKVGMCFGNDEARHYMSVYFGIQKLGALPVPINPRLATPEKLFILEHSDASALITSSKYVEQFGPAARGESVQIEGRPGELKLRQVFAGGSSLPEGFVALDPALESGSTDYPVLDPLPGADDPVDIMYTSGTTGMPKGVVTPQGNLIHEGDMGEMMSMMFGEGMLLHTVPLYGYTGGHGIMMMALSGGVTQRIPGKFDVERFFKIINDENVTAMFMVPTMLNLMVNHPDVKNVDFSRVRFIATASAPLPIDTVRKMKELWPDTMLINAYGQTEAGGSMVTMLGPMYDDFLEHVGSIGRPMAPGVEVVVVDRETGEVLPPGQIGEICFKSEQSRRFYYKGEDKTKEAWRGGMLHTGDVGYVDEDGYIYLTDRIKDMVLRGGYNIFAVEVENVLYDHPDILEAAVVGIPHPRLGEDVLAVVVPMPGKQGGEGSLTPEAIYDYCKQHLADYKCPRHVVFVEELPRNAMGKLLKAQLREAYQDLITSSDKYRGEATQ